jgi:hypothetical protein
VMSGSHPWLLFVKPGGKPDDCIGLTFSRK